ATQQLDAVQAHDHAFVGGVAAGKAGLAVVGHALVEAGCAAQHDQAQAVELDAEVGDHEGHWLAVGDRLAECLTLVDVLLGVLEDGLAGAGSQCGPARRERRTISAYCSVRSVSERFAPPRRLAAGTRTSLRTTRPRAAARRPMDGS